jgi:adenine-specific DNA-methyltransferase
MPDGRIYPGRYSAREFEPEKFEGEKILIRKIVGDTLIATYVPRTSYSNTLLFVLKLNNEVDLSYLYILGMLNSRFIGWYFRWTRSACLAIRIPFANLQRRSGDQLWTA